MKYVLGAIWSAAVFCAGRSKIIRRIFCTVLPTFLCFIFRKRGLRNLENCFFLNQSVKKHMELGLIRHHDTELHRR